MIEDVVFCENVELEVDMFSFVVFDNKVVRRSFRFVIKFLKNLLLKRCNQVEECLCEKVFEELNKFSEMQILKDFEINIKFIDGLLYCELELILGYCSSVVFSVYFKKEKSYREDFGSY